MQEFVRDRGGLSFLDMLDSNGGRVGGVIIPNVYAPASDFTNNITLIIILIQNSLV